MSVCCGRTSLNGKPEKISPWPKHEQRPNPFSTSGLDKFHSLCAELSARRKYIANKIGVPEDMVRFVASNKGWVPILIGVRDEGTRKKNSDGDASEDWILGPENNKNGGIGGELKRKDEGDDISGESERKGLSLSTRTHASPTDSWPTAFLGAVNLRKIHPEQNFYHHLQDSAAKMFRWFVSIDNWASTRPASPVHGLASFCREARPAMAYDTSVGAFMLFCFAILFTIAWLYLVSVFDKERKVVNMFGTEGKV